MSQPVNSAQEETLSVEGNEQKVKNFNSDFAFVHGIALKGLVRGAPGFPPKYLSPEK